MKLSDIDLRLLRVFKAVAQAGGFARAQGMLGISQPAISSHIANLEQRLNVRLCNRGPQGFSLTAEGQEVLEQTDTMLAHLDAYAEQLNNIGKKPSQKVRIGAVDSLVTDANNPLPGAIRAAKAQVPGMQARVGVYDYLDCLTELRAGRLDLAILGVGRTEQLPDDLQALHIYDEASGLYCAPDHPCGEACDAETLKQRLSAAKISAHSFLSNPIDDTLDILLLEEAGDISLGNVESTVYLVLAGTHVGLVPHHYADHWVQQGKMVPVASDIYRADSRFLAVQLKTAEQNTATQKIWAALSGRSSTD